MPCNTLHMADETFHLPAAPNRKFAECLIDITSLNYSPEMTITHLVDVAVHVAEMFGFR